jgi:peptidyl-prolyl cis-trans isomerase SurA
VSPSRLSNGRSERMTLDMRYAQLFGALSLVTVGLAAPARATIAERVVAVVGDQAILLSEMRQRARPFLLQIRQRAASGAELAAAESKMYEELVQQLVDYRIEQLAAEKARLTVTPDEIDAGLRNVAGQQGLTVEQLMTAATNAGLTAQEYRDEVRRQILDGKLLQLRVRGRVRVTEEDLHAMYAKLVQAERARLGYRLAWIVVRGARAEGEHLAARIAATAKSGTDAGGRIVDFADLARAFSDDTPTRSLGGDLGMHRPGDLAQALEDEAQKLEAGGVSAPFRFKGDLIVLRVVEREPSQLPSFEQARDELLQRAYGEQMQKARKQWIDELRRGTYIDVRF